MNKTINRVLILGGDGFIGKHLIKELGDIGTSLIVFDLKSEENKSSPNCIYIKGDFGDPSQLESVINHHSITHVVHLVSTTIPKSSNDDIPYDLSSNVIQTIFLLDICVKYKIKKILFMSSGGTIYGVPMRMIVDENHPNNPICSYGINKLTIEKYLFLYHHLYGLNYIILRAANPYGPGQNHLTGQGVIPNFVHKIYNQEPLEVWGDGSAIRDYFHVRDLANLVNLSLFSQETGIFNAGSGVGISIRQLINMLASVTKLPVEVIYKEQRSLDVPAIVLNSNNAEKKFGWHASISIQAGIENYIKWYLSNTDINRTN